MIVSAEMKLKGVADAQGEPLQPFPARLPRHGRRELAGLVNIHQDAERQMRLEKQPFDRWPS